MQLDFTPPTQRMLYRESLGLASRLMREPKVSVVIPCHNGSEYLRDCLRSIAAVSCPPNPGLEVVVVDDGSTEDIRSVVLQELPLATYIRQERQGPAAARNRGIAESAGEYIRFLDADDFLLADHFWEQVALLDAHPDAGLVYGQALSVDAQGRVLRVRKPSFARSSYVRGGTTELSHLLFGNYITTSSTLVRRSVMQQIGLFRTDLTNDIGEDWDCWIRLAKVASMGYLAKPVAAYRFHDESAMARHTADPELWLNVHLSILDTALAPSSFEGPLDHLRSAVEAHLYYQAARVAYRGKHKQLVWRYVARATAQSLRTRRWRDAARSLWLALKETVPDGMRPRARRSPFGRVLPCKESDGRQHVSRGPSPWPVRIRGWRGVFPR